MRAPAVDGEREMLRDCVQPVRRELPSMRVAYADPPYPGMSHYYREHPDYAGEVDHADLIARLNVEYDCWILHTASTTLRAVLADCPDDVRILAWCKSFFSFKPSQSTGYAWEPVIMRGARVRPFGGMTTPDFLVCPMTLGRGLVGAKPELVCHWLFNCAGMEPDDQLADLFPGTGAVSRAWESWRAGRQSQLLFDMPRCKQTALDVEP